MVLVLPGLPLVLAKPLLFTKVFISDDLPTLDLPAKAISGSLSSGYCSGFTATLCKSAFIILITLQSLLLEHAPIRLPYFLQGQTPAFSLSCLVFPPDPSYFHVAVRLF